MNFFNLLNKHVSAKKRIVQGNHAPFMAKEFQKASYSTRAAESMYAVYARTFNYSYVRRFEICCTCTYIKYCLCKYAKQEVYTTIFACSKLFFVHFSGNVLAPLIVHIL